jgi:hypothetical protein
MPYPKYDELRHPVKAGELTAYYGDEYPYEAHGFDQHSVIGAVPPAPPVPPIPPMILLYRVPHMVGPPATVVHVHCSGFVAQNAHPTHSRRRAFLVACTCTSWSPDVHSGRLPQAARHNLLPHRTTSRRHRRRPGLGGAGSMMAPVGPRQRRSSPPDDMSNGRCDRVGGRGRMTSLIVIVPSAAVRQLKE